MTVDGIPVPNLLEIRTGPVHLVDKEEVNRLRPDVAVEQ